MKLVLFPTSYPYDYAAEQTFLEPELPILELVFDEILLVPRINKGKRYDVSPGIKVVESLADYFHQHTRILHLIFYALTSRLFYRELIFRFSLIVQPFKFIRLMIFCGRAEMIKAWFYEWMKSNQLDPNSLICYSFWFDESTMGLTLIKQQYPGIVLVSRANGYDIFEESYFPHYLPCRMQMLPYLDKIYTASKNGRDYLADHFPEFKSLFEVSYLGIPDPGIITSPSNDGIFRIVSCSNIFPIKRLDLMMRGIALAAKMRPEMRIEWQHFGEGKQRPELVKKLEISFPCNATGYLPGFMENQSVLSHYKNQNVDVFINTSKSEGGAPVAIMEAISCGIPVIATKVGGNPEIVSDRNGILLEADPTEQQIAEAILWFYDNPNQVQRLRKEARSIWEQNFTADANCNAFAIRLLQLVQSKSQWIGTTLAADII